MKNQTLILTTGFFALRILSFYTYQLPKLQAIIGIILLLGFTYLFFKNTTHAWYQLLAELILGGTGLTIEIFGLSLRLLLLTTFMILWIIKLPRKDVAMQRLYRRPLLIISILVTTILTIGTINGLISGNAFRAVIQDLIPFSYLLLIIPGYHIIKKENARTFYKSLALSFIISTAIFTLFNLILFSSQLAIIHQPYYNFLRDVLAAKITHIGFDFWRIVFPEHLLLLPAILFTTGHAIKNKLTKYHTLLLTLLTFTLAINLSRGIILALIAGLGILAYKNNWKQWLKGTALTIILFISTFTLAHILTSKGTSPGWEHFGVRFASIATPDIEVSANTRKILLKPIFEQIQTRPIIGHGLGSSITFYNPVLEQMETSRHYDWGYFELWAELGLVGLLTILSLISLLAYHLLKHKKTTALAIVLSLCVFTVVGPGLSHVFGIAIISGIVCSSKLKL